MQDHVVTEPFRAELPRATFEAAVRNIEQRDDGWQYGEIWYAGVCWQVMSLDQRWVLVLQCHLISVQSFSWQILPVSRKFAFANT